ncbi:MAG: SgcJ/EcaC family oxidoreductase [Pirellulales bacterium]|nr:SgcJ/EcaC family oxidoreductase [Pirellulales bacterium]
MNLRRVACSFLLLTTCLARLVVAQDDAVEQDRKAILARVKSYVEAFNAADASTLAGHWSESAEYITPAGDRIEGRQALAEYFAQEFAENPGRKLDVQVDRIRFATADTATEEGTARVASPDGRADESSYLAVHVRRDGQWQLDTVRELTFSQQEAAPPASTPHDYLQDLEWLIGEWRDADNEGQVATSCRWVANQSFISRSFRVAIPGQSELVGTQVIGWDPVHGQVRSWVFDSDGGFGEGFWKNEGDHWTIQTRATLPDGRQATAVQILTPLGVDRFSWESTQREVDGVLLPNIDPVTVTRDIEETTTPASETERPSP